MWFEIISLICLVFELLIFPLVTTENITVTIILFVSVVFWEILCPPQLDQLLFLCLIGWFYILVQLCFLFKLWLYYENASNNVH